MSWTGGDWMCGVCEHQNFKKREACQRCGYPKYGGPPDVSSYVLNNNTTHDHDHDGVLAGDWYCISINCGAHNYASRPNCFRCGAFKTDYLASAAPPGWKSGDWICNRYGCGVHNYASRTECYKCRTPKDYGAAV